MNRFERKARLKATKAAQKAAKKALRLDSGQAAPEAAAVADPITAALAETKTGTPSTGSGQAVPESGDSPHDQVAAARELYSGSGVVTEAESAAMLSRAARLLDDVIAASKAALATVSPARLREALEMANAKPAPAEGNAQQRPRRGYDPVLTLIKLAISASSLQQRVLSKLAARQSRRAA